MRYFVRKTRQPSVQEMYGIYLILRRSANDDETNWCRSLLRRPSFPGPHLRGEGGTTCITSKNRKSGAERQHSVREQTEVGKLMTPRALFNDLVKR